jgi:hypothetical protein
MGLIVEAWDTFRVRYVPANASPQRVLESERAFYAGIGLILGLVEHAHEMPEDGLHIVIGDVFREFHAFWDSESQRA